MDSSLLGRLESRTVAPGLPRERHNTGMQYVALECPCGSSRFRVAGWPRIVSGRGGFFWRTVSRVWREARVPMQDGEPVDSPFWLPLRVHCEQCDEGEVILDGDSVVARLPEAARGEPRESYRCRVCRRGSVELWVGEAIDSQSSTRADYDVVTRCGSCEREARIAWSEGLPSAQEVRLDVLYGRR